MNNILDIHNFSYKHPDRDPLFNNIDLQIAESQKIALVGRNGVGKTTLLNCIYNHDNIPSIKLYTTPYFVRQNTEYYKNSSVGEVLGVEKKIEALNAISKGSTSQSDYDMIGDDWDIENKIKIALSYWELGGFDLNLRFDTLSGGEKVKVLLSAITLHQPKFVLLDEPTNHLDHSSREKL